MTDYPQMPTGVMLNVYPDSIGGRLADLVSMLQKPHFRGAFSLCYLLPTVFNSDLDRGFSIIDYNLNRELVTEEDLNALRELSIKLKFDLVLNHLSVGSPQFQDLLKNGDASPYRDFFIDWNEFWRGEGEMGPEGYIVPNEEHLKKLFMRKPGLPILMVRFPDGSERPYWNTFYQQVDYHPISAGELKAEAGIADDIAERLAEAIHVEIEANRGYRSVINDFFHKSELSTAQQSKIIDLVEQKKSYLGQMDLNADSEQVWQFFDDTIKTLKDYGATLVRLDAFAYLHKKPGKVNFFNKPETWQFLARLRKMADRHGLVLLPEIHSEYGAGLHEEVAAEGFPIYDFFLPGLLIDALDRGTTQYLKRWIADIRSKKLTTINMLGCHDGIPILDLRGSSERSLLSEDEIEAIVSRILARGGRVKNLYGPEGKKIAYYQVNATFFSALGEDEQKLLLARAIQLFMPGIPQVWYLDLFAGKNDYEAADKGGAAGHKEINRTTITLDDVENGLTRSIVNNQLSLMYYRNRSTAFGGELKVFDSEDHELRLVWKNGEDSAELTADLKTFSFAVKFSNGPLTTVRFFPGAGVVPE